MCMHKQPVVGWLHPLLMGHMIMVARSQAELSLLPETIVNYSLKMQQSKAWMPPDKMAYDYAFSDKRREITFTLVYFN